MNNSKWLKSLNGELDFLNNNTSQSLSAFYLIDKEGELNYNLAEWMKYPWTPQQFFCLLARSKLPIFLEFSLEPSSTTFNISTIKQIKQKIELYYPDELWRLYDPEIQGWSKHAKPVKWLSAAKAKDISGSEKLITSIMIQCATTSR